MNKVFYINVTRYENRRIFMESQFRKQKIKYIRYPAIDHKNISNLFLNNLKKNKKIQSIDYINKNNKKGTLACLLSHTNLWKKLKDDYKKEKYFLIMEDDAKICDNLKEEVVIALNNAPKDWEMIWLGYNEIKGTKISDYYFKPDSGRLEGFNSQHHCYLIKNKAIAKITKILFPLPEEFITKDSILRDNFDKFKPYFYYKKLAYQDQNTFPKSIRTGGKNG